MEISTALIMIMRLAIAGLLGTLIGLEREYRAKEAGMRTHFLVALGRCLIMIVSQYGFGASAYDGSRVAAQIVSGIGFIGAGTIMMQNQFVRGLTTAAGLWVAAGIGMAIGGGLYIMGIVSTLLVLLGLELFGRLFGRFQARVLNLVFTADCNTDLVGISNDISQHNCRVVKCTVTGCGNESNSRIRVEMVIHEHGGNEEAWLLNEMNKFENIVVEKIG